MILTAVAIILIVSITVMSAWLSLLGLRFLGTLESCDLPTHIPSVTTIVPARNEERNIGRCASGLTMQDYPDYEMVFVDDDSEDRTGDILADFQKDNPNLKIVNPDERPKDWNGKQWACHSGALQATGEWLCFMDADTFAEPDCLSRTVAFAEAKGVDMLTLQPWYELHGLWERIILSQFLAPLMLIFPPNKVNDPDHPLSMANGQFILIRRSVYDAIDGHRSVRNRMMDDFPLAEQVKSAGHRLMIVEGFDVMRVRLYSNLREIWAGAMKASVEITGGWKPTVIAFVGNLIVNVLPPILLALSLLVGNATAAVLFGVLILGQITYYGTSRVIAHRIPPWTAVMYPIAGMITGALLGVGMWRVARGDAIQWKGRDVLGPPSLR